MPFIEFRYRTSIGPGVQNSETGELEWISNNKTQWNLHSSIVREKVTVREMTNVHFEVEQLAVAEITADAHEVTEGEMAAGVLVVDRDPWYKGGTGNGVEKVAVNDLVSYCSEAKHGINRDRLEAFVF